MSNPKLDFSTVIKTSISSITKHPINICPSSNVNATQTKVESHPSQTLVNLNFEFPAMIVKTLIVLNINLKTIY